MQQMRELGGRSPGDHGDWEVALTDLYWRSYVAPWRYNQLVGFVRLFILGTQVRGDLCMVNARRYGRNLARKQFAMTGKAFESWTTAADSNTAIFERIESELEAVFTTPRNRTLRMDLEAFRQIAAHLDFRGMIGYD
jgi:hypothetical protein